MKQLGKMCDLVRLVVLQPSVQELGAEMEGFGRVVSYASALTTVVICGEIKHADA